MPPTDQAHFWSQAGPRLAAVDANLFGHPIAIGGTVFPRGIAAHSGYSGVWRLAGMALSFSAAVGIEDEAHAQDGPGDAEADAVFAVLVDRRVVERRTCRVGAPPQAIAVGLAGAQHLELRIEYGRSGFVRQRGAFAAPLLRLAGERPAFLAAAAQAAHAAQEERERPAPAWPVLPAWEGIALRREPFRAFPAALTIDTGACRLVVVPDHGGMVVSCRAGGGGEMIAGAGNDAPPRSLARGLLRDCGGHFVRSKPRNHFTPAEPLLLAGPYQLAFPADGVVELTSRTSPYLLLRQRCTLTLRAGSGAVAVRNTLVNAAPFAQEAGVWSLTRLRTGGLARIVFPVAAERTAVPESFAVFIAEVGGSSVLDVAALLAAPLGKGSLELLQWTDGDRVEAAFSDGSRLAVRSRDAEPYQAADRDRPSTHLYLVDAFTEVELHGPVRRLEPGGEAVLSESWECTGAQR
ncbi:MAG: NPCBM/NEW2 domain-containing protein [Planctomycetes bacterium]|nr:NPCBM/NEW2 domain-containing protein [Planctomycetota bacterium]